MNNDTLLKKIDLHTKWLQKRGSMVVSISKLARRRRKGTNGQLTCIFHLVPGDIVSLLRGFISLLGWKSDMDALLKDAGITKLVRIYARLHFYLTNCDVFFFLKLNQVF